MNPGPMLGAQAVQKGQVISCKFQPFINFICSTLNFAAKFNDFAAKKNTQYGTPKLTISPLFFNDSAAKAIKFAAICLQNRR